MSMTIRRTGATSTVIPGSLVTRLGHVRGAEYATIDYKGYEGEWTVSGRSPDIGAFPESSVLVESDNIMDDGTGRMVKFGSVFERASGPLPAGSYETAKAKVGRRRQKLPRPADALVSTRLKGRGSEAIIGHYANRGVAFEERHGYLVTRAPRAGLDAADRILIDRAAPLLVAHLRGEPLMCVVNDHQKPAATVLAGGAPACEECLS